MANKFLLCFALLVALSAVTLVSAAEKPEKSSEVSGSSEEKKSKGSGEEKTTKKPKEDAGSSEAPDGDKPTTKKPKMNRRAIEKVILHSFRLKTDPKEDDFNDLLKAMEFSDNDRKTIRNAPHIDVTVSKRGRRMYTLWVTAGMVTVTHLNYELGEEFKDKLFDGRQYKGTITFEGKNKVIKEEKHLGFNCRHESIFTEKGFTINYECKGKKAVQEFKRKPAGDKPNNQNKGNSGLKINIGR